MNNAPDSLVNEDSGRVFTYHGALSLSLPDLFSSTLTHLLTYTLLLAALISPGTAMPLSIPDSAAGKGVFFRDHWVKRNEHASNNKGRLRVNDRQVSLDERWGKRAEGTTNGLMLADVPEDLFQLCGAELYLELWGGHPGTENKRFTLNGYGDYAVPEVGTATKHCTYSYPVVPVEVGDLVSGVNAIQFTCERGKTFWGHYIIDQTNVRCFLKADHADLDSNGLGGFAATPTIDSPGAMADTQTVALEYLAEHESKIAQVEYFARYDGYDDRGSGNGNGWHGYTHKKKPKNHVGTAAKAPFAVKWNTRMIPTQDKPMAVVAVVRFANGISYRTPVLEGLSFPKSRPAVTLHYCDTVKPHFWSRDKHEKKAAITLTKTELGTAGNVQLVTRVWDGGAGEEKEPFTLNGTQYDIISGKANHDVVFTRANVPVSQLKAGRNEFRLYSDTHHHGIEMLLPGPALIVRGGTAN